MASADLRSLGAARSMDLIMYVLYSDDQLFVRDMVTQVVREVSNCYHKHVQTRLPILSHKM